MNNFQHYPVAPSLEEGFIQGKKRKICESNGMDDNRENVCCPDNRMCHAHVHSHAAGRHFLHLRPSDGESIFQTEDWQPSGSTLFFPLVEDLMVNTSNIEQFSCTRGNFFVAGEKGVYSKSLSGDVLHLWRFCPQKKKLFISRSFLFTKLQDFHEIQQMLQRL